RPHQRNVMAGAKRSATKAEPSATLAALIAAAPKLSLPQEARGRVEEWLGAIAREGAGKALKRLLGKAGSAEVADFVPGVPDGSPFLWDLIQAAPARFLAILEAEPEAQFAAAIATVTRAGLIEDDEAAMMRALRRGKAEAALLIALADIGGVWPV